MTEHSLFRAAVPAVLFACAVAVIAAAWWWLGRPVAMPPSPLARGEKLYCVSYAPFRGTQSPLNPPIADRAVADRRGSRAALAADRLRAHLFDRVRARPHAGNRQAARPEGHAGHLAVRQCRKRTRSEIDTAIAARQAISRRDPRARRRQRGAAARRDDRAGSRRDHPRREERRPSAGDLCRCLGILAAPSRRLRRGRFRHHPYPSLLGGLPDLGAGCRRACGCHPHARSRPRFPTRRS